MYNLKRIGLLILYIPGKTWQYVQNHDDYVEYNLKYVRTENVLTNTIHVAFMFVLYWGPVTWPLPPISYGEAFFGNMVPSLLNSTADMPKYKHTTF